MKKAPIKLGVMLSGTGRTLQNLIDLIAAGELDATVSVVVASRPDLVGSERATKANIMNFVVDRRSISDRAEFSRKVFALMDDAGVDLVCMAGWLSLIDIPKAYEGRVINIHPSLLPSFGGEGLYGSRVHQTVIDHGVKVSGCTVHFVDAEYDNGPIILQRACPVLESDDAHALADRVFEEEKLAYPQAIRLYQQGRLKVDGRRVRISGE